MAALQELMEDAVASLVGVTSPLHSKPRSSGQWVKLLVLSTAEQLSVMGGR